MAHVSTTESYIRKVCRIAKELDISIDEAAMTCDAFHLAFSDHETRRAIFGMIDQLGESAARKGEPLGLIITYVVELGADGINVGRYADYVPPGQAIELPPANQAMILLRITEDFPTQEFLGPMIVNRPEIASVSEPGVVATGPYSDESEITNPESGISSGVVCSDSDLKEPVILLGPSSLESPNAVISLGPIRLKFAERFPFVYPAVSSSQRAIAGRMPAFQSHHLSLSAALPAGNRAFQSGLSPPLHTENLGHSDTKDVHWQ